MGYSSLRLGQRAEGLVEGTSWPTIVVVGAGAVGCYFGGMLARAGAPVTLIGRGQHVEAITQKGLYLDSLTFQQSIPITATTSIEAVRDAELILVTVKTPDTQDAARAIAPHLSQHAVVVSLQNGVDNVERIRAVLTADVIPAVVYVACSMSAPGCVKHSGRGDLILGDLPRRNSPDEARCQQLDGLASLFVRGGIPCRVSDDVEADLWAKLTMNCAYNAISALSRSRYARITANSWTRDIMRLVVEEIIAVARAAGVNLKAEGLVQAAWNLADTMPQALSSTAQDINRGKHTEIDALNGHVAARGATLGIATPVNQTLHALVKLLEEAS